MFYKILDLHNKKIRLVINSVKIYHMFWDNINKKFYRITDIEYKKLKDNIYTLLDPEEFKKISKDLQHSIKHQYVAYNDKYEIGYIDLGYTLTEKIKNKLCFNINNRNYNFVELLVKVNNVGNTPYKSYDNTIINLIEEDISFLIEFEKIKMPIIKTNYYELIDCINQLCDGKLTVLIRKRKLNNITEKNELF